MVILEAIGLTLALISGARAAAEIPKVWREGTERQPNQRVLYDNNINISEVGRGMEAQANMEVAISQSRDQRIVIGEVCKTMRAIQEYQMMQTKDNNHTIRTMHNNQTAMQLSANQLHRTMLNNQTMLQLSADRLYSIMLENDARVIERIYADQLNQRIIFLCLTIIIAYSTYLLGVLQTENSWRRTILLSTSTLEGLETRQHAGIQLDLELLHWLHPAIYGGPAWHTITQLAQFVVIWGNRALGFAFTGFQLIKIWNIHNQIEHKRSYLMDAFCMTLFCSPFRSFEIFMRVTNPAPWIIAGCLLDCFFLYCHTMRSHRKLKGHTDRVISVAFSPDGTKIASGSDDRSVRSWDTATGRQLLELKGHIDAVNSVLFSPDGTKILSCSNYLAIRTWDAATGKKIIEVNSQNDPVLGVLHSPDGTKIAHGQATNNAVWVRDAGTGEYKWGHSSKQSVISAAFSSDGRKIATSSEDGSVSIWDNDTRKLLGLLIGHAGGVRSVSFSPDNTLITSGSDDHSIRIWHVATGRELEKLNGHTDSVHSVAFSPDGTKIASGSNDGSVMIWDVAARSQLQELKGHIGGVHTVAFTL